MSDLIKLAQEDDDITRARNILMVGGFVINETAAKALTHMANAIRLYRDIDAKKAQESDGDYDYAGGL